MFVSHLEATSDGTRLPAGQLHGVHQGKPLLVRYDLDRVAGAVQRDDLRDRDSSLWRYRELMPLVDDANLVSLGEGMSPLLPCPRLARSMGIRELWIKDESQLPTGSFKCRGMTAAVSMAKELGVKRVAIPTQGNAGGALAAYAARAGMECWVFMPDDTPVVNRLEAVHHGARAFVVDGLIHECGSIVREGAERMGWFDMSTLREPYRIEGKKTMGLELAEQMGWKLPDVILYPTGGGTGLIGMWKGFAELVHLGWLESGVLPRMFSCQSSGCASLALAFDRGEKAGAEVDDPHTRAAGIRVPRALGDFLVLDAVRCSGGRAMAADEDRLEEWMHAAARLEGISLCPEAAMCLGVLETSLAEGHIGADESAVVFNTGAVQKYVELLDVEVPRLELGKVDWTAIEGRR